MKQKISTIKSLKISGILAVAADGYIFAHDLKGGHGTLNEADSHVELLIYGPGVPTATISSVVKTIEITPQAIWALEPTNSRGDTIW